MDPLWSDILQVALLLLAGSALRFILPYIIAGLTAVGDANSLSAWPAWEWKYITSIILAMIAFGISLLSNPGGVASMLTLSPWTIVLLAYSGQDILSRTVKPFRK